MSEFTGRLVQKHILDDNELEESGSVSFGFVRVRIGKKEVVAYRP